MPAVYTQQLRVMGSGGAEAAIRVKTAVGDLGSTTAQASGIGEGAVVCAAAAAGGVFGRRLQLAS